MDPVAKALWFVESNLREEFDLKKVAEAACISRFHLCRVFASVTGMGPMQYVRVRRLGDSTAVDKAFMKTLHKNINISIYNHI